MYLFVGAVSLCFIVPGGLMAWGQWHDLRTFVPTEAEVTGTEIKVTSSSGKSRTSYYYHPFVYRRYRVNRAVYVNGTVLPLGDFGSDIDWAKRIVGAYHRGDHVITYYKPSNPDIGFLLPQLRYDPFLFVQFPMLVLLVFSMRAVFSDQRGAMARRNLAFLIAAAWWAVGLATSGWYFRHATDPRDVVAIVATTLYAGAGLVPTCVAAYYTFVNTEPN
jgi:hypothetical protein